jgi:hypothetical protein
MILTKEMINVVMHDTSTTGIRYKLRIDLGKKIPKAKLGSTVLDVSNNLYRATRFRYAINPEVKNEGKHTVFYYFFNDVELAQKLSIFFNGQPIESESMYKALIKQRDDFHKQGYPAYTAPYYYAA